MIRAAAALVALTGAVPANAAEPGPQCQREIVVLGAGQDAGAPQIGNSDDDGPVLLPSSLALIDRAEGKRYLFDATPAITQQLAMLDAIEPPQQGLGIDGIFLTHAHIGHYFGLAYLGREAVGADHVPVFAMKRMREFLGSNGPWSQLVGLGNIELVELWRDSFIELSDGFGVQAIPVPHREEYSETVAFMIKAGSRKVLYVPDIDGWPDLENWSGQETPALTLLGLIEQADLVFVDATFWDDNELLDENGVGRDMSEIPHPRVTETMDLMDRMLGDERGKIHFIHYNHTNPIRDPDSAESKQVVERGFTVARRGDRICLD